MSMWKPMADRFGLRALPETPAFGLGLQSLPCLYMSLPWARNCSGKNAGPIFVLCSRGNWLKGHNNTIQHWHWRGGYVVVILLMKGAAYSLQEIFWPFQQSGFVPSTDSPQTLPPPTPMSLACPVFLDLWPHWYVVISEFWSFDSPSPKLCFTCTLCLLRHCAHNIAAGYSTDSLQSSKLKHLQVHDVSPSTRTTETLWRWEVLGRFAAWWQIAPAKSLAVLKLCMINSPFLLCVFFFPPPWLQNCQRESWPFEKAHTHSIATEGARCVLEYVHRQSHPLPQCQNSRGLSFEPRRWRATRRRFKLRTRTFFFWGVNV